MKVKELIRFLEAQPQENEVVTEFVVLDMENEVSGYVPVSTLHCVHAKRVKDRLFSQMQDGATGELVTVVR